MGKSKLKSSLILILILSIFGTYLSCKKIDNYSSNSSEIYIAQVENRFLNEHGSSDPTIRALINFVKRKNENNHFISKTVERIGYPYWDKALSIKKQSISGTIKKNIMGTSNNENITDSGKSGDIFFIPFVRDEQNHVNASMVFKTSATDTSFYYVCDWQYQDKPHGLTATYTNAEGYAVFFMMLDNRVLGHTDFKIKDLGLFPKSNSQKKKLSFIINPVKEKSTNDVYYVRECLSYYVCGSPDYCRERGSCDYNDHCPSGVCYSDEFCYGWLEYGASSGSGNSGNTGSGNTGNNSGGGGGTTGNNNNNTPPDCSDPALKHSGDCEAGWEPETPVVEDPCIKAKAASVKMTMVFEAGHVKDRLAEIPNLATETNEKGFPIYENYIINPFASTPRLPTDTSTNGYTSGNNIQTGTDSNIVISSSVNPNTGALAAMLHTHPPNGLAAQSPRDLYELIGEQLSNNRYKGSFVAAADGSKYALVVTNLDQAAVFYNTMSQNLDGANWKKGTEISKEFKKATKYFEDKYDSNPNKVNLAYEMAMAAVLSKFNIGVALNKQNVDGKFIPVVVNGIVDPNKPKKIIYTQDCL